MIDEDQIIFNDVDNQKNFKIQFDEYDIEDDNGRSPTPVRNSNLAFDDCVKLNVFKKSRDVGFQSNALKVGPISDNSLIYLTQSNKLIDSFDMKLKFENIIADKKFKESKDFKKKKFDNVKTKLNENRNPNIKNLLKDITKQPVESTVKKLQDDYKKELDNLFKNKLESFKSFDETLTEPTESNKTLVLENSEIFETKIKKKPEENNVFLTEETKTKDDNSDSDSDIDSDESSKSSKKSSTSDKFKAFELKYQHLLKEESDLSTKSSSTVELMKDEDNQQSDKDSKKTSRKKDIDLKLPAIITVDHEAIAKNMRLTLFNSIHPSESSLNRFNNKLDDLKQIHLPSFQIEFHQVCQYADDSRIVKLVTEDIDYDVNKKQNGLGRYSIHECCLNGNVNMLKGLLQYVDDLNKKDNNGQTAAHVCATHGELECLKILAANSADLLITDRNGMQLGHLAAQKNHKHIIEFLFQMGISLKTSCNKGKLPIHYAAENGSFESLKLLTQFYVDISQTDNDGNYAAHLASMNDKLKCLKYLVKIGSPLNASLNKKGRTFAHVSALNNSVRSLHWLLENGADKEICDVDGNSLTHLACLGGSANTMNCCLQHDLSLTALNNKKETPIDVARTVGKSLHIQKAIVNEIRCPDCVKIAIKRKWDQEHEKTIAEKTIEKNKHKYYVLKKDDSERNLMLSSHSKGTRDLIAQYFGPTFQD